MKSAVKDEVLGEPVNGHVKAPTQVVTRRRSPKRIGKRLALQLWLPLALIALWWWTSVITDSPFYPPLPDIVAEAQRVFFSDRFTETLLPSLKNLVLGFVIALVLGLLIGCALGLSKTLAQVFSPVLDFFRATPNLAVMPIFIAVLGIGSTSAISLIVFAAIWPILISTADGVANVEPGFRDVGTASRMSLIQRLRYIEIPGAMPRVMAGVHTAVSISVTAMVGIELFAGSTGLGSYLAGTQNSFNIPGSWAGALVAGLVGLVVSLVVITVERKLLLSWYFEMRAKNNADS